MYENIFGNPNLIMNIIKVLGAAKSGLLLSILTISDKKYSQDIEDKGIAIDEMMAITKQEYDGQFKGIVRELIRDGYILKIGDKYHPSVKILCLM